MSQVVVRYSNICRVPILFIPTKFQDFSSTAACFPRGISTDGKDRVQYYVIIFAEKNKDMQTKVKLLVI